MAKTRGRDFTHWTQEASVGDSSSSSTSTNTRPTSSNTVTRPTSNTVTRPTTSSTVTRPTSSNTVTRPTSNTVTRPSGSGRPSRPSSPGRGTTESGRVDAPVGKGQYINTIEDATTMETRFLIEVKDPGRYPEQVAELVVGPGWRKVVSDYATDINISMPEQCKDQVLTNAAQVIALGAKAQVEKSVMLEFPFQGLEKGCTVADQGEVYIEYKMTVKSFGRFRSKVQELVLGNEVSGNLQLSLPLVLEYPEWQKDKMLALAQKMLDLGAAIDITKLLRYTVPLN